MEIQRLKTNEIPLKEILKPGDVLLVTSPFLGVEASSLGIHLLQAACRNAGIDTSVLYSNLIYSSLIGIHLYREFSCDSFTHFYERNFASAAFGVPSVSIKQWKHRLTTHEWIPDHFWSPGQNPKETGVPKPYTSYKKWLADMDLESLEFFGTEWIRTLTGEIAKAGFRIVGCSTTCGGLVPTLALLGNIKKANPNIVTVLGGALCEEEMADGILSLNAGIDYIFAGDGEITFPLIAKQILEGRLPEEKFIRCQAVTDLDSLPLPDYKEYVEQLKKFHDYSPSEKNSHEIEYALNYETSRGCPHKCTFCGLNGKRNKFHVKSPDKIIEDLKALSEQSGINNFYMCDTILASEYFETLLPRLAEEVPSLKIFYEIKPELSLERTLLLKKSGIINIQVGIESLSPGLLRIMNKPCTVRENIAFLRYVRSIGGFNIMWLIPFGFPGDKIEQYEEMLHLFPLIRHLPPPKKILPLVLFRYSTFCTYPKSFGISGLHPAEFYKDVLPPGADLEKVAYYYTSDFPSSCRGNVPLIDAMWDAILEWQKAWSLYKALPVDILLPSLHVTRKNRDLYILEDTRGLPGKPGRMELDEKTAHLLLVARPVEKIQEEKLQWALDAGLGVVVESLFIPLATAEPNLLLELEKKES
jgi:ribosomal peptide maturation radical SAM protein 1